MRQMSGTTDPREVRRIAVVDPIAKARPGDYADAFEAVLPGPDPYPPEEWVRAGLGATSGTVRAVTRFLGFGRAAAAQGQAGPWRVVESTAHVVHLETSLSFLSVVMVGRRVEPTRRTLTTVLHYRRPTLARLVWAVIGPVHRRTARRVLTSLTSAGDRYEDADRRHPSRGD
jgi:hypothetical protein